MEFILWSVWHKFRFWFHKTRSKLFCSAESDLPSVHDLNFCIKKGTEKFPAGLSGLRIWHYCHCCGTLSIPSPKLLDALGAAKLKKKKVCVHGVGGWTEVHDFSNNNWRLNPTQTQSIQQEQAPAGIWHRVPIDLIVLGKTALIGSCSFVQLSNRWGDEQQNDLAGTKYNYSFFMIFERWSNETDVWSCL